MNRRIITGLILLMGVSLLGIIAVQVYWFNNSVKVSHELFDRSVVEAMNKAVRRLETRHDLKIIRNIGAADYSVRVDTLRYPPPPPPPPPFPEYENINVIIRKDSLDGRTTVITSRSRSGNDTDHSVQTAISNSQLRHASSKDSIIIIRDSAAFIDLPDMRVKAGKKLKQLENLTKAIEIEYKGWNTGRRIDQKILRKLLIEEFADKDIPINFKDTIQSAAGDGQEPVRMKDPHGWYRVNLFPNDIFRKNLVLAVSFPKSSQFTGQGTTWLLGLSAVFTLIIFLTFSLSIFLIIRQKKISEMKSDFINNMTHEFKTPIATISIASDSILNDKVIKDEEKVRFFAGMIQKENVRMNDQVERILQIARLDRKEFEFNFQAVNVHDLIGEAIQGIMLQVGKKGGQLITKFEASNPVVTTDPIHFTNLVYNLLDNANKYSPESPLITITTTNIPKGLILSVEDHGIGMSKAVQAKIFDKFYRLSTGNIHTVKGFGLGLSYVKAIIEANHGSIKVYSNPDKGSRFEVFFPFLIN